MSCWTVAVALTALCGACATDDSDGATVEVLPLHDHAAGWNDYVDASDPQSACDAAQPLWSACAHAGELRQVLLDLESCAGVSASDALGAFSWRCEVLDTGIRVLSDGLAEGVGLSDLIDFNAAAWHQNQVNIAFPGGSADSEPAIWWSNPVHWLDETTPLDTPGTIYLGNGLTVDRDFAFSADRVALVVQPGILVRGTGDEPILSAEAVDHIWVEGSFASEEGQETLSWRDVRHSVIDAVHAEHLDVDGGPESILGEGSVGNRLSRLRLLNQSLIVTDAPGNSFTDAEVIAGASGGTLVVFRSDDTDIRKLRLVGNEQRGGIFIEDAPRLRLHDLTTVGVVQFGVSVREAPQAIIDHIRMSNGDRGFSLRDSPGSVVVDVLVANSGRDGLTLSDPDTVVVNAAAINNDGNGFELYGDHSVAMNLVTANNADTGIWHSGDRSLLSDAASAHNGRYGIIAFAEQPYYTGALLVGDNELFDCNVPLEVVAPGLVHETCESAGLSDIASSRGVSLADSFVGKVTTDDGENTDDDAGQAAFDLPITDWLGREHDLRAWGVDGAAFPSVEQRNECLPGDICRLWDFSLASADSWLRSDVAAPTGDDALVHTWSAADSTACEQIRGALWDAQMSACRSTFLRGAVELLDDGVGNDNGLCEADERCLVTPNIGVYQGHGELQEEGAATTGTVPGVTFVRYAQNGR